MSSLNVKFRYFFLQTNSILCDLQNGCFKLMVAHVFSCSDDSSKRVSLANEKMKYPSGTNGVNILQHTLIGNWNFTPLSS